MVLQFVDTLNNFVFWYLILQERVWRLVKKDETVFESLAFMILNMSNTKGGTSGAGIIYPSGITKFIPVF